MAETYGRVVDELLAVAGRQIKLDTQDGVHREGRLSRWNERELFLNGRRVLMPIGLELNGDPMDVIELDRIATIDIIGE